MLFSAYIHADLCLLRKRRDHDVSANSRLTVSVMPDLAGAHRQTPLQQMQRHAVEHLPRVILMLCSGSSVRPVLTPPISSLWLGRVCNEYVQATAVATSIAYEWRLVGVQTTGGQG